MLEKLKESRYFLIAAAVCGGYLAARVILRVGDGVVDHLDTWLTRRLTYDASGSCIAFGILALAIALAVYIRRKAVGKKRAYVLWPLSILLAIWSILILND